VKEDLSTLDGSWKETINDWPAINRNPKRARIAWGRIGRILTKERAEVKINDIHI
jgi:hypothetical protein